MMEEELHIGSVDFDITDIANEPDEYVPAETEFKFRDLNVPSGMKMAFVMFLFITLGFSIFHLGIFPILIISIVFIFCLDLMGALDWVDSWRDNIGKPRGGYENIE